MEEQGITITFRGDTVEFDRSLDGVNKALKSLKSEMTTINQKLKLDPKNIDLLRSKFNNLKEQQKVMTEQVEMYKRALESIPKDDIGSKEWLALTKQLGQAEVSLERINKQLSSMPDAKVMSLQKTFQDIEKSLTKTGKAIENVGKKFSVLSGAVGALGVAGVRYNAQLEQYQVALTTLLGTEEEASKVMAQIQQDAAKTPFDVDSLTQANSLLISAGIDAEESRQVILALGDAIAATGGGSAELSRMAQNLQQIQNVGKATAMDIRQFANAGINIYGLLADYMGTTTEKVKDMDISFEVLSEALKSASQEGGKYFGAMENQSQTINGTISTLKDNISILLGELTKALIPTIKRVISTISNVVQRLQGMSDTQKNLVMNIGLLITALGPALVIIGKVVSSVGVISGGLAKLTPILSNLKGGISGILNPVTAIISVLALLYATNEDFRNSVNQLVGSLKSSLVPIIETVGQSIGSLFAQLSEMLMPIINTIGTFLATYIIPTIQTLITAVMPVLQKALELVFGIISKLVEWLGNLWKYLEDRGVIDLFIQGFENIASVVQTVVDGVKALFGWFGSLIDKAKEFLGINGQVQQNASVITDGRGIAVNYGSGGYSSGGFASGGLVMNNTINVSNGNNITASTVLGWADLMTDRINENLGRLI